MDRHGQVNTALVDMSIAIPKATIVRYHYFSDE